LRDDWQLRLGIADALLRIQKVSDVCPLAGRDPRRLVSVARHRRRSFDGTFARKQKLRGLDMGATVGRERGVRVP
jgi:hypothetical protein